MLYLVPTPIGNLQDITFRAIEVLKSVDIILAEDTRVSGKLLKHYEIKNKLVSFHAHNEHHQTPRIIEQLSENLNIALISDAGTPGISDPGFLLVRACVEANIEVQTLPGATAFVPAIVTSGFPSDRFYFEGFLPKKKGRQTRWKYLATLQDTIVLYESPHRIEKCVNEIIEYLGPKREICISREISKLHEEHIRGTAEQVLKNLKERSKLKGEIVLICKSA